MDIISNHLPILECIAKSITDYKTFMAFMMVNKKFLHVAKYIISQTPAIYIANIEYDTSPVMKLNANQTVFDSLRELFTSLHQAHLENPPTNGTFPIKNFAGPCDECLLNWRVWLDYGCGCEDISYRGIIIVKYFQCDKPKPRVNWCPAIDKPTSGFLLFKNLPYPDSVPDEMPPEECLDTTKINQIDHFKYIINRNNFTPRLNYKSMEYLYRGAPKHNILRKLGIREWWLDKWNRFYPATTDILHRFNINYWETPMLYKPDQYIHFDTEMGNLYSSECGKRINFRINEI